MRFLASFAAQLAGGARARRDARVARMVAGDLAGVAELAGAGTYLERELAPADVRTCGRNLVNLLAPAAACRPFHQVGRN